MRSTTSSGLVVLACGLSLLAAGTADAGNGGPPKCQLAIARAAGTFLAARVDVLRRCEKLRLQGILPPGIDCITDDPNAAELQGVEKDLADTIDKACGGADRTCGTTDDVPLSDAGWGDVTQCPDLEHSGCTAPIASCKDVTTCIECVGTAASNQAIKLDFGDFVTAEFGTDSDANQCQEAIGRASTKFLQVLARSLGRCEVTRMRRLLRGKDVGECMGDSGKMTDVVAKAEGKKRNAICKACGGSDAQCGTSDDLAASTFGFASQCPAVSVPSGGSCGGAILDLSGVVDCVDCVARFKAECMSALATPGAGPYPPQCNPAGATCGDGKLDPGEQCDPGGGSAGGAFPCPGGQVCTAQCTCEGGGSPTCGNGKLDPGEQCDPGGGSAGGAFPCPGGAICSPQCTCEGGTSTTTCSTSTTTTTVMCHDMTTTTTSTTTTTRPSTCGNGKLDPNEECDTSSPSGCFTCPSGDTCDPTTCTCVPGSTTTTLPTPGCGNGVRDPGEQCDPTSPSGAMVCPAGTTCSLACTCVSPSSSTTTTTIGAGATTTSTTLGAVTTTTIMGATPTVLDFINGTPGGVCGSMKDASNAVIRNLTCGGLNIGGGTSTVIEGPTPDGSTSRYALSCTGASCTIGATSTAPAANSADPDCTTTGCNFGTPLPIPNGGTSTCVLNTLSAPASGTFGLSTGAVSLSVALNSSTFLTGNATQPCPQCSASGSPANPGHGTCDRGANAGGACTSTNSQGLTRDCVPGGSDGSASLGAIAVNLTPLTTGASSKSDAGGLMCSSVGQAAMQKGCFGSAACVAITENGTPAGPITANTPASATLASVFCIPSTSSVIVNFAANLPGPGATSLPGTLIAH